MCFIAIVCGGHFNAETGEIDYPLGELSTYAHNQSCSYIIETEASKVVNITFIQFNMESGSNCQHDWLQIHDGRDASGRVIGRFCGSSMPPSFVSTTNRVYMWMRTDHSISRTGFKLLWHSMVPQCGFDMSDPQDHGAITSPGYPGNYPHNRDCVWTLRTDPGKRIQFLFATLHLESHQNCSYDFLEVYNGDAIDGADHQLLGRFCNSTTPPPVTSSSNVATLHFHSDNSLSDTGFSIAWTSTPGLYFP